ncbi:hypothetical protein [Candidatus Cardinium hertigii]|uniref:Uncharacterized protein n=1 Tax=Candidatus Cardinium hertigii TaxID=247481 RepID=A0A2Z3LEY5_9BACT|nr:hypothetical protein [Candidatus Cardinium hertigii]AWN82246.1 hypothetical protein DK880_00949 [Candidatus Cardinium hertigii]
MENFWLEHTDAINFLVLTTRLGSTDRDKQRNLCFVVEEVTSVMRQWGISCTMERCVDSLYAVWNAMQNMEIHLKQIKGSLIITIIVLDEQNKTLLREQVCISTPKD